MGDCTLCELSTPETPVTAPDVAGEFCCRGCLAVAESLDGLDAAQPPAEPPPPSDPLAGEVAYFTVDGMHCGTCETFLAARAMDHPGIEAASASYATGTMQVRYDPDTVDRSALPDALSGLGYSIHDADVTPESSSLGGRLLVGAVFGMMTMLWYLLFCYPVYLGLGPELRLLELQSQAGRYLGWNLWLMATVVLGYTGSPLLRGAYVSCRTRQPNMDLLVALAATTAYAYSTGVLLLGGTEWYFDVTVVIVVAVTGGTVLERRMTRRSAARLTDLIEERVDRARRRVDGTVESVAVETLTSGDSVIVHTGERIPVDGTVIEGTAAVDESLVSGEARPRHVTAGASVIGGALVTDGRLVLSVDDTATSTLERVLAAVWEVQSTRPGAQRLADRLATVFVPAVLVLAVCAGLAHAATGATPTGALLTGLAVLVVSCPCALGLATPLAVAAGIRETLRAGIVVTTPATFESVPDLETLAIDKTGTLTTGSMTLVDATDERVRNRAAAVEQYAAHPIARAITDAAAPPTATVSEFTRHPGRGVSAEVDGEPVMVGRRALFAAEGWSIPLRYRARAERARAAGETAVFVGWDGAVAGVLVVGDRPRAGWAEALDALDCRVVILTGDDERATAPFSEHPAVDDVFTDLPPEGKAAVVEQLRRDGPVAMVGDGTNDGPALAAADVGIAMERSALAADAADAVITTGDLHSIERTLTLARATHTRIRQNVGWALVYNAVAIPVAAASLLTPLVAAVAMATSSLLVVGNSTRDMTPGTRQPSGSAGASPDRDAERVTTRSSGVDG